MKEVVIVSAVRTAIGNFGGALAGISATELGIIAAKEAIVRAGINPSEIYQKPSLEIFCPLVWGRTSAVRLQ